jgi:signal transduction histidine kinase
MTNPAASAPASVHLLFVDDEPAVLDGIARSLHFAAGRWTTHYALGAEEALALIREHDFRVVVSDMRMPGMNGDELLRRISELAPDCVRIMLTGQLDLETALSAVNQGHVFQLLIKPCERELLRSVLEQALRQYELQTIERTSLRHQLAHSQKIAAVGELAAGVVHDVNNILAVISALSSEAGLAGHQGALGTIYEAANRASELTRELMGFCRRDEAMPEDVVDVGATLASCARLVRPMITCLLTLRTEVDDGLPGVSGHAGKLKQIIMNLAINARDATPEGGEIVITARKYSFRPDEIGGHRDRRAGEFVRLAVSDTGRGMDAAHCERIFEPYFTTKAAGAGTGLGLALVQRLVQEHRGWIEVTSVPGKGSTFAVYLPCASGAATVAAA